MKTTLLSIVAAVLATLPLSSKTIKIACPDWDEGMALSYIVSHLLEEKLGYEVEITELGPEECFKAVAEGSQDVFLNAWLPFTHNVYWEQYNRSYDRLGTAFFRAATGLAVPGYMDVDRIADLNQYGEILENTITGIEADAGMTVKTKEVIEFYSLDYTIQSTSTREMLEQVEAAIEAEKPIVFHAWKPHWMFAKYDIKMLSDDRRIFQMEGIRKLARLGFAKEHKKAARIIEQVALTEEQFGDLLLYIDDSPLDMETDVQQWMAENPELVKVWGKTGFRLF